MKLLHFQVNSTTPSVGSFIGLTDEQKVSKNMIKVANVISQVGDYQITFQIDNKFILLVTTNSIGKTQL